MELSNREFVFLFSDIESSTSTWERYPNEMKGALERHDTIVTTEVENAGGKVVKTTGDGFMAVFADVDSGVVASSAIQLALDSQDWGPIGSLKARMGLHLGDAQKREDDYFGPSVNRTARLMSAGHGGQILLSAQVSSHMPPSADTRDLGIHRLKDLAEPEHIFQLVVPGLDTSFAPLVTLDTSPNNLPTQTSSFLGRDIELDAIRNLIEATGSRLITLLGTGGTGKTRLGLQAAADQVDRFSDGVFFVDLSTETQSDESLANVARVVGIDSVADESALQALERGLQERATLLVLDNLEQIDGIGVDIDRLLQVSPGVVVIATSRAPLRVRGEQLYPVDPLGLPDMSRGWLDPDQILESEAVLLFVERAQQQTPGFIADETSAQTIGSICVRLDGLPLAIELAAARLRMFTLGELHDRLNRQLDVLKGGAHDLPERQKTLRNTIEWSYELLRPNEQGLLELLSVFASASFGDLEAIAEKLSLEGHVLDQLDSLVDKSLVRKTTTASGHSRFGLLETIRSFAHENSQERPIDYEAAKKAHAVHFADLATHLHSQLKETERERAKSLLTSELENFQISWTYWTREGAIDRLHQLFDPMWILYDSEGWYQGAVTLAEDLIDVLDEQPDSAENTSEQIALRTSLARARMLIQGYTEQAETAFLEALAQAEESGATPQLFPVLRSLASLYIQRRDSDAALDIGRQLLAMANEDGNPSLVVDANLVYGVNRGFTGNLDEGLAYVNKAVEAFDPTEMHGERFRLGPNSGIVSLTSSAFLLTWQGYPDRARERAARALSDAEELDHSYSKAYALFHVAFLSLMYRDLTAVAENASQLLALANQYDYQIWRALAMVLLGVVRAFTEDPVSGAIEVEKGIDLYKRLPTPPVFWAMLLSVRAPVAAIAGDIDRGLELIAEAISLEPDPATAMAGEMYVTQGDLLLMQGREQEAAAAYALGLENATENATKSSALRSLTRLVRGGDESHREHLENVYDSFTEGFDTLDLVEAREVLGR